MGKRAQRVWLSWAWVGLLVALCGVLAVLQYQWIGKTTEAERNRLRGELHSRLVALSRAFNGEAAAACDAPAAAGPWFRRVAAAVASGDSLRLLALDRQSGEYSPAPWPAEWASTRANLEARLRGMGPGAPPDAALLVIPQFPPPGITPGGPPPRWLLLQFDTDYIRGTVLPRLIERYLAENGRLDYEADLLENGARGRGEADDSVTLLDLHPGPLRGPRPEGGFGGPRGGGPPPPPDGIRGPWRLVVRHTSGSLEALVEQTRRRNLAIAAGILLLILATAAALARFTRRAQRLAELQMDFVAGVSHELRTPLTVIRTAAYNLRGRLANRPDQVERYGVLIQAESERLEALVEQVLRFASIEAGHAIRTREPVAIDALVGAGLRLDNAGTSGGLQVEKHIEGDLPAVLGDPVALRQAIQNLVDNALKYGAGDSHWIGLRAGAVDGGREPVVEIRVADRGPGIPPDEQRRIFDPFFRGRQAVAGQVHGTGLGLSLAKKIVEAHGGSLRVKSEPRKGTEFIVRFPALRPHVSPAAQDAVLEEHSGSAHPVS